MTAPRTNRRDFLIGKAAARAAAAVGEQLLGTIGNGFEEEPSAKTATSAEECYLVKLSRRAMACQFEIWLNAGQYADGVTTGVAVLDLVDQLEAQLTVYRDTSEISCLNRTASAEPVEIESRLCELLARSIELSRMTGGAFDITAGPLSALWGFKRRTGKLPEQAAIAETLEQIGSQFIEVDSERHTVRFLREGIEINLGAIGKGYTLDRCAEVFAAAGINDFLLHGGNSSVLGRGSHAAGSEQNGWSVGVRDPLEPERRLGELRLRNRALATSGSAAQHFIHEGKRYGHILDPRTGWPAEGVLTATVLAPTAAEADALSTALYVLGPEAAEQLCAEHPEYACLMLCPDRSAGGMRMHNFGLTTNDWSTEKSIADN